MSGRLPLLLHFVSFSCSPHLDLAHFSFLGCMAGTLLLIDNSSFSLSISFLKMYRRLHAWFLKGKPHFFFLHTDGLSPKYGLWVDAVRPLNMHAACYQFPLSGSFFAILNFSLNFFSGLYFVWLRMLSSGAGILFIYQFFYFFLSLFLTFCLELDSFLPRIFSYFCTCNYWKRKIVVESSCGWDICGLAIGTAGGLESFFSFFLFYFSFNIFLISLPSFRFFLFLAIAIVLLVQSIQFSINRLS
ncbi:hypothetical protein DFH27DRAFT_537034 [Peziza echinospora]|nr:hypothetical protein DFH27DRAFT_537034 [Peziza echinospora]